MAEPRWVPRIVVDAVHLEQVREHGGLLGLRDENALESALGRPRQKWQYDPEADIPELAAAYGFGLCRNHPYRDGNKRVAFIVMVVFLELNGLQFDAPEADVVTTMLGVAGGQVPESGLARWLRAHAQPARGIRIRRSI
jgi:death on curing protein